ncbi:MAG: hypothetical protein B7Y45_06665 [Sphingomonas sp. 28-66-16]|nr:MAG: hypothetical protein B7Y45_06665 [Sphingomonas sp. 28-66-16]
MGIKSVILFACLASHPIDAKALAQTQADPSKDARGPDADPSRDAPIISERQFDAALPLIDPALSDPLPPIDQAELPLPTTKTPPDPALTEPLPALGAFNVTPPPAAAEAAPEAAPSVHYSVAVEGLDKVDLEGRFRSLSALDNGDGDAASGAVITARAKEDEDLAVRLLKSEGYYDAVATSLVNPVTDQPNRMRATISVTPGPRYTLGTIAVTGPATVPADLARTALPLKSGDPIVAAMIQGAEASVSVRLPQKGYPFAMLGQRDIVLDDRDATGDYSLPVDPGPRSSFGRIVNAGDAVFAPDHVALLARFRPGALYDSRRVEDLREALVATSLLSSVAIQPVRTGETRADGTEQVDLEVRQQKGPARTLAASLGYATGEGFKLQGNWTHRNLFPPEGALTADLVLGSQQQSIGGSFRRSNAGRRDRTVLLKARASHDNFAAYEAYTMTLSGRISRDSTPIWQKRWTYSYGFDLTATDERRADPTRGRDDGTYLIAALPGELGYDRSNSILNPTSGFRLLGRLSPEYSKRLNSGGGSDIYFRAQLDATGYYPISDSFVVAGRVRFGSIIGANRDAIAPSRRFYAGGGGSVRGFGYQQLGPRDANDNPLGGRGLTEFALEGRYRFGNLGIVPFIDAGQVSESSVPSLKGLRFGAGIGGRLYTNFGPLRIDVATPINRRPGESVITLYLSIGQAF